MTGQIQPPGYGLQVLVHIGSGGPFFNPLPKCRGFLETGHRVELAADLRPRPAGPAPVFSGFCSPFGGVYSITVLSLQGV